MAGVTIGVRKLHEDARLPEKAHPDDAGWDVFAHLDPAWRQGGWNFVLIPRGDRFVMPIGLSLDIPPGWEVQIRPRSGLARKHGLTVLNSPSTIDAGFQGEVAVLLYNAGGETLKIEHGQKIAQLIPQRLAEATFQDVTGTPRAPSARGEAGWGSSGSTSRG